MWYQVIYKYVDSVIKMVTKKTNANHRDKCPYPHNRIAIIIRRYLTDAALM